jgi:hypothetical protein
MYRRALLIYVVTIVLPAGALLWLGIQSFERQRHALATLTAEKVAATVESRLLEAARSVFDGKPHPATQYFFNIEHGEVVKPALHSLPPLATPREFANAENEELVMNQPGVALGMYQQLEQSSRWRALALSREARCLTKLARADEARSLWRELAANYPDERDLTQRRSGS